MATQTVFSLATLAERKRLVLWAALIAVLACVALYFGIFAYKLSTPFSVSVDTTSVDFVTAGSPDDPNQAGLFAGPGTVDVLIEGCDRLSYIAASDGSVTIPCNAGSRKLSAVQLETLHFGPRTRITASVVNGAVRLQLQRPSPDSLLQVTLETDEDTLLDGEKSPDLRPGEWSVQSKNVGLTLVLHEGKHQALDGDQGEFSLVARSSVYFEGAGMSALVGSKNVLHRPQLPGDKRDLDLGVERFYVKDLRAGRIRKFALDRDGDSKSIKAFHIVLTGHSTTLLHYDADADSTGNEALTEFGLLSGGDKQFWLLGIASFIVAASSFVQNLVSALQTLFRFVQAGTTHLTFRKGQPNEAPPPTENPAP